MDSQDPPKVYLWVLELTGVRVDRAGASCSAKNHTAALFQY